MEKVIILLFAKLIGGIITLYVISKRFRLEFSVCLIIFIVVALSVLGIGLAFNRSPYAILISLPITFAIIRAFGLAEEPEPEYESSAQSEHANDSNFQPDDQNDEWVVVKTYMDSRAIAEVERDKQILVHNGIANYVKTVGFTNLYVAAADEEQAHALLNM